MRIKNAINPAFWVGKMIDKRIALYNKGVGSEMKYNPLLVTMKSPYNDTQMTRRMLENSIWYSGDEQDLSYFYRVEAPKFYRHGQMSESMNYFWGSANNNYRKVHSGFPQLISEKMVDLIIGNGFSFNVEGQDEEEIQAELDEMLKENKISNLMGKGIETESFSGGVSWKITRNPSISRYPIIESWQPENYTNVVVSGRIVEDIFYKYYEKGEDRYRLTEMYGVGKKGAYIDYKLDKLVNTRNGQASALGEWREVSLKSLEQTKELNRLDFNGYYKRLSLYKPNKLPNSEFRYSILGESDYAGSYGAFDGIDEVISTMLQEFRDGKLVRYFPKEFVPKNSLGEAMKPDEFKRNHILYEDSPMENMEKSKILYMQGELRIEKHLESYKMLVTQALNNSGLSPLTVGITGMEAIDSSAESQQEREKVSIRTRNKKIELWKVFLEDIIKTALEFHYMTKDMKEIDSNEYAIGKVPEFDLIVTFEDYIIKSMRDRTNEVSEGIGVTWDTLTGVQYVHKDKTLKEQLAIAARIKLEKGIETISTPEASALQDVNLIDEESLKEDKVNIIEIE
ncbi:MAG: hypothetical protein J7L15_05520 [Clostridiales bacterium]|nr:hypothetical protein [Clostridiales bacterium]